MYVYTGRTYDRIDDEGEVRNTYCTICQDAVPFAAGTVRQETRAKRRPKLNSENYLLWPYKMTLTYAQPLTVLKSE